MPVPPRPRPLKLLKASVAKPRPSYLKSYSSVCLPGNSASAPSQRTRSRSSRFHTDTGLPLYRPRLPGSPVGAYAALVAGGSYSARKATGGTAPACSLPLIGRRVVIGIVVASCRGGRSRRRGPDRDPGRHCAAAVNRGRGIDTVVAAAIVGPVIGAAVIAV